MQYPFNVQVAPVTIYAIAQASLLHAHDQKARIPYSVVLPSQRVQFLLLVALLSISHVESPPVFVFAFDSNRTARER